MADEGTDFHWRNTMRPVRFFAFDSRAVVPFILVFVHMRIWTLMLALLATIIFWLAERAGYGFEPFLRRSRCMIVGPKRPGLVGTKKRHLIDYGT